MLAEVQGWCRVGRGGAGGAGRVQGRYRWCKGGAGYLHRLHLSKRNIRCREVQEVQAHLRTSLLDPPPLAWPAWRRFWQEWQRVCSPPSWIGGNCCKPPVDPRVWVSTAARAPMPSPAGSLHNVMNRLFLKGRLLRPPWLRVQQAPFCSPDPRLGLLAPEVRNASLRTSRPLPSWCCRCETHPFSIARLSQVSSPKPAKSCGPQVDPHSVGALLSVGGSFSSCCQ